MEPTAERNYRRRSNVDDKDDGEILNTPIRMSRIVEDARDVNIHSPHPSAISFLSRFSFPPFLLVAVP